jgi:hypothetical protein
MKTLLLAVVLGCSACTTYNINSDLSGASINIAVETPLGVVIPAIRDPHNPYRTGK